MYPVLAADRKNWKPRSPGHHVQPATPAAATVAAAAATVAAAAPAAAAPAAATADTAAPTAAATVPTTGLLVHSCQPGPPPAVIPATASESPGPPLDLPAQWPHAAKSFAPTAVARYGSSPWPSASS